MLVDVAFLIVLGVGHDAAGHGSGNLSHQHLLAVGCLDHDVGVLVLLTGLRQPGLVVVAVLMMDEQHPPVNGEPVGMHVEGTHEDADHQSLVVEILGLFSFLDDYNLSVGRSHDGLLGVAVEIADGAAIEIEHQQPGAAEDGHENDKRYRIVETPPENNPKGDKRKQRVEQFVGALTVYSYLL